jgi:hypothetical protein
LQDGELMPKCENFRRELEPQRVPAPQPRFANLTTAVEYQEPGTRSLQVVRRRESGLSGADHDGVVEVAHQTCAGVRRSVPFCSR